MKEIEYGELTQRTNFSDEEPIVDNDLEDGLCKEDINKKTLDYQAQQALSVNDKKAQL